MWWEEKAIRETGQCVSDRLISHQGAVWKWFDFSRLFFNYIWARHWRLHRVLGLVQANSWQHSSCYCVNCEVMQTMHNVPMNTANVTLVLYIIRPHRLPSLPSMGTAGSSESNLVRLWTTRPRPLTLWPWLQRWDIAHSSLCLCLHRCFEHSLPECLQNHNKHCPRALLSDTLRLNTECCTSNKMVGKSGSSATHLRLAEGHEKFSHE